jgi:hypothetical protein
MGVLFLRYYTRWSMIQPLIQNIHSWQSLTNNEILAILNTASEAIENHEKITWAGVAFMIGPEAAEMLRVTLKESNLEWANLQLGGLGIDCAHPMVQGMLTQFEADGLPGMQQLREYGVRTVSPYVKAGGVGLVTIEQVNVAVAAMNLAERKQQLKTKGANEYNQFIDAVDRWNGTGNEPDIAAFYVG